MIIYINTIIGLGLFSQYDIWTKVIYSSGPEHSLVKWLFKWKTISRINRNVQEPVNESIHKIVK